MSNTISVSQMDLVVSILNKLGEDHPGFCASSRQYNAVIKAANDICDAMANEDTGSTPGVGLEAWLQSDDVGSSSKYMASILTNENSLHAPPAHPRDPSDFGRCRKLLLAVPEFKERLSRMSGQSEVWGKIISNWDRLCLLMDEESPGWADGTGSAPKTYSLMKELGC